MDNPAREAHGKLLEIDPAQFDDPQVAVLHDRALEVVDDLAVRLDSLEQ